MDTQESQAPETVAPQTLSVAPRKSRFVDENELLTVELGDGDWVKIPSRFSYGFSEKFQQISGDTEDTKKIVDFVLQVLREWNIVDFDGNIAAITVDNIRRLEIKDLMKIINVVNKQMKVDDLPKDKGPESEQQ